ncbi:MAG: BrnT family toxin [Bacteroidota bacterium]
MDFQFEWDPRKDEANIKKHRVSFWEASTVLGDPLARYARDTEHSNSEERMQIVGICKTIKDSCCYICRASREYPHHYCTPDNNKGKETL